MAELLYEEHADLTLRTLEADPTQGRLLGAVDAVLADLETTPHLMRHRRYANRVWRVDVRGFDWMVIWEHREDELVVRYIGPAL